MHACTYVLVCIPFSTAILTSFYLVVFFTYVAAIKVASCPGSLRGGERAWYTLCAFPNKHWEFTFLSIYVTIDLNL